MIAVFLGFATDPDPVIKMTGIGLATAVLVDVTLVRLFMAPAALTLLGDRLWPSRRDVAPSRVRRERTSSRAEGRRRRPGAPGRRPRGVVRRSGRCEHGAYPCRLPSSPPASCPPAWRPRASRWRSPSRSGVVAGPRSRRRRLRRHPTRSARGSTSAVAAADLPRDERARRLRDPRRARAAGRGRRRRARRRLAARRHRAGVGRRRRGRPRELPRSGRRLGRPFLERHASRVALGPRRSPASTTSSPATAPRPCSSAASPGSCARPCRSSPAARACRCAGCCPSASLSALIWTVTFTLLGYAFSDSYQRAGETASRIALVAILLAAVAFAIRARRARPP